MIGPRSLAAPDPAAMAALHALCFTLPPPWSEQEFRRLLSGPGVLCILRPGGFALGRVAGGEAELLTLAVDPAFRRRGTGRALLAALEHDARLGGALEMFLEVAETNIPARALYAAQGYLPAGRRRGYYRVAGGTAVDALVLRHSLTPEGNVG